MQHFLFTFKLDAVSDDGFWPCSDKRRINDWINLLVKAIKIVLVLFFQISVYIFGQVVTAFDIFSVEIVEVFERQISCFCYIFIAIPATDFSKCFESVAHLFFTHVVERLKKTLFKEASGVAFNYYRLFANIVYCSIGIFLAKKECVVVAHVCLLIFFAYSLSSAKTEGVNKN